MIERPQRIVVAVRKMATHKLEGQPDSESIIVKDNHTVLAIEHQPKAIVPLRRTERKSQVAVTFDFDQAFDSNVSNEKVYQTLVNPLMQLICRGGKALCIDYAPTAVGKASIATRNTEFTATYRLAIQNLFKRITEKQRISLVAYEVWEDKQNYLLSEGNKPVEVATQEQALSLLELTSELRILSQEQKTSHFFLQICLKGATNQNGVITFVELDGGASQKAKGNTSEANRALLMLQERDLQKGRVYCSNKSRLAQALKDSFEGSSKTVLLINVNPSSRFSSSNIDILRLAQRLKGVRPQINNFRQARNIKQMVLPKPAVKLNDSNGAENAPKPRREQARVTFNLPQPPKALQPCHKSLYIKNFRQNIVATKTNRPSKKSDRKLHNKTFSELPMKDKGSRNTMAKGSEQSPKLTIKTLKVLESDSSHANSVVHCKTQDEQQNLLGDPKQYLTDRNELMFGVAQLSQSIFKTVVWSDHPPDLIIPLTHSSQFKWDNVVKQFDEWDPQKQEGKIYFSQAHQFLIGELVQEEDALGCLHSQTVSKQVQTLKNEIDLVNKLQKDRAECDPLDYIDTVEMAVELKISILLKLKQKITGFRRHLQEQQRCEDIIRGLRQDVSEVSREFEHLQEQLLL